MASRAMAASASLRSIQRSVRAYACWALTAIAHGACLAKIASMARLSDGRSVTSMPVSAWILLASMSPRQKLTQERSYRKKSSPEGSGVHSQRPSSVCTWSRLATSCSMR